MSSIAIQAIDPPRDSADSERPTLRVVPALPSSDGVISGVLDTDTLRLWRRWIGRRTILQLGCSPMVKGDPAEQWDVDMYDGMLMRRR